MESVKVSVIVPIYNMDRYLEQCIQSLIMQTYDNLEIILVNDGSTDRSAQICRSFSEMDSRVIYIEQENQGVSVARNTGLYRSRGQWVSFVDGDDWATPDMISTLLESAQNSDVVIGNFYVAENDKLTEASFFNSHVPEGKKLTSLFLIGNALCCEHYGSGVYCSVGTPWAKLYRREFLINHSIAFASGVRRMQDVIFNVGVFSETQKVTCCSHSIYYYRITDDSACRRYDPNYNEVFTQVLLALDNHLGSTSKPEFQKLYEFKRLWLVLEYISRYYGHPQCSLSAKDKRDGIKSLCFDPANAAALKKYSKEMFTNRQQLILWLLSHRLYGIALFLYNLRNKYFLLARKGN